MTHRILHLLGNGELEGTSVVRTVASLARCMDAGRYRIHAWFLGNDGPLVGALREIGVQTAVVRWRAGIRDPRGALRFWNKLHGTDFAIVHQHFGGRSVRWMVRRASRAKIIVHLHGRVHEASGEAPVPAQVEGADAVIAVSDAVARQVRGARACVVYPGVKMPRRSFTAQETLRPGRSAVIGTACRLVAIKGLQYLLQAIARLRAEFPEVRLEIAGSGVLQADLERQVHELGLAKSVTFLGWQPDMAAAMSRWNVYVQPSIDEGFGIAALEAMATGLPVVATGVGGTLELVQDGATGWLVPPRDPAALAGRIGMLLGDEHLRRRMGHAGRRRAGDCFAEHRMVGETAAIYSTLARHPRAAG